MNYDWKRYWHKFGDSPHIINGFLHVSEYLKDVSTLDEVLDASCLILLGEPGMGKSNEIERIYKAQIVNENNDKLYFPLSSFSNEDRLVKEIFQSEVINQWKTNNKNLHLYLDGLDEALLSINTLALLLTDEIEKLLKDRLFFRIACRTAEWSNLLFLENKLKGIWKEDKFKILQIAPLQSKDVEIAAQTENLDGETFLAEIYNKSATALASKPVTLQLLLNLFRKNSSFPNTQTELYEKGCLNYCEENNERRRAAKRIGNLTSEQRFIIASRIAALIIFGNKSSIWIGGITGEEESSDIFISELSEYSERRRDNSEFQVSQDNVKEVIFDTGLFTGNGYNRIKFFHQTFAEFLASWYLQYKKIPDEIVIKIIGEEYLYPQLYETSAWIANQRPSIFHHLMKVAPAILLRSDILLADESSRTNLVDILLDIFDKEKSEGIDRNYYRKLKHPKIAEQIKPYIIDKSKGWLVRSEALDMVQVCEIKELQDDLIKIALDRENDHNIRVHAAYAVAWVADSEKKAELKPLVFGNEEDDPRFRLKGVALDMLWDEYLTAKELFSVLSTPSSYFTGSYEVFLHSEFIEKLKIEDLPVALDWLIENIGDFLHHVSSERKLADKILLMAWENLEKKEIFDRFIRITKILISNYDELFKEIDDKEKLNEILQNDEKRRKIWLEIFPSIDDNHYWAMEESKFIGLRVSDISWLVHQWEITDDEVLKAKLISRLLGFIHWWGTLPEILDEICKACDENEDLWEVFKETFAPIELNTKKAVELKKSYEEATKWKREREKKQKEWEKPIDPSPLDSTLKSLEKFENDEINSFIDINYYLMFLPNGRSKRNELEADLTQLPVWQEIDENARIKIVKAAKIYLEKGNPENEKWIGTNNIHRPAFSGYRALALLEKFDPIFIKNVHKNIWEKWAAIIYYYPIYNGSGNEQYEDHLKLIAQTYLNAPENLIALLKQDIEKGSEENYWSLEKFKYCWDKKLEEFLKSELKNNALSISATRSILSKLFVLEGSEAEKFSCDFIKFPVPENKKEQELLMIAVELLISHGKVSCWEKIWNIIEKDSEFGSSMIEYGCFRFERATMQELSEKHLADLYLWLSEKYPHKEDPVHHGVYSPSFRDKVTDWRESLLSSLVEKGTIESVKEVERIKNNLTEVEWLKRTVLRAEEKRRTASWQPFPPQELLEMFCVKKEQVQVNPILENIERKIDSLSSQISINHQEMMEQFANKAIEKVQSEISKLTEKEREEFEEVKKGKWETKLKFVIPLIPKIPILGEFFPSASIEITKAIESEEYMNFVQRKLYGEKLQTNILQNEQ